MKKKPTLKTSEDENFTRNERISPQVERAIVDAVNLVRCLCTKDGRFVAGGGACEMQIAKEVTKLGDVRHTREKLHSKRVYFLIFTRFECTFLAFHSFRMYFSPSLSRVLSSTLS